MSPEQLVYMATERSSNMPGVAMALLVLSVGIILSSGLDRVLGVTVALTAVWPEVYRIDVGGVNFNVTRLLLVAATTSVLIRGGRIGRLQILDAAMLCCVVAMFVATILRGKGLASSLSGTLDLFLAYVLARVSPAKGEVHRNLGLGISIAAIALVPIALSESLLRFVPYSVIGGVDSAPTEIRDGIVRVMGPASHPILFGVQWACLAPLVFLGTESHRAGFLRQVALASAFLLAILSMSSTSFLGIALIAALLVARRQLSYARLFTYVVLACLAAIHVIMPWPVWALLAKVNIFASSTGWHRFALIDNGVNRLHEWWLIGLDSTAHWGWGLWDVTNHFLLTGLRGGLVAFLGLVLIWGGIVWRQEAVFARRVEQRSGMNVARDSELFFMTLVSLAVCGLGVAYYGPTLVIVAVVLGRALVSVTESERMIASASRFLRAKRASSPAVGDATT